LHSADDEIDSIHLAPAKKIWPHKSALERDVVFRGRVEGCLIFACEGAGAARDIYPQLHTSMSHIDRRDNVKLLGLQRHDLAVAGASHQKTGELRS
jgi:hypothetical protein